MSALWVLALGASIGYLGFKKQAIESRLDHAVKEWEGAGAAESDPKPPDGANFKEIKQAWKYTEDTRNEHFNERLPKTEREQLLAAEDRREAEVQQFDQSRRRPDQFQDIEGVYLEQIVPV